MEKEHILAPNNIIFCEKQWKPLAAIFTALILLTFLWAFYILDHYLDAYDFEDYSISATDGGMAGLVTIANQPMQLQSLVTPSVVTIIDSAPQGRSLASGAIIHPDGYILTTAHSLKHVAKMAALVHSPQGVLKYEVKLVKLHQPHDLALLKMVTNDKFLYLRLADTRELQPGAPLHAFGKTLNGAVTARSGTMAQRGIKLTVDKLDISHLLKSDIAFTPQHSGGPIDRFPGTVGRYQYHLEQDEQPGY